MSILNLLPNLSYSPMLGYVLAPQIFATAGTFTFTWPSGSTQAYITMVGGGGGGSTPFDGTAGGSGGGSGEYYLRYVYSRGVDTTETVVVGHIGTATSGPASSGGNGGTSSFGTLNAVGGFGSLAAVSSAPAPVGIGGGTGTGPIHYAGVNGGQGGIFYQGGFNGANSNPAGFTGGVGSASNGGGGGAASPLANGGAGGITGTNGTYGSGGGGEAGGYYVTSGAGGSGYVKVEFV
jgi:hypothetical protein